MENKGWCNLPVVPFDHQTVNDNDDDNDDDDDDVPQSRNDEILVANFDHSFENYLKKMDQILKISGESEEEELRFDQSEFQRMSCSVSFIRDWGQFCSKSQVIRFACQSDTPVRKDVTSEISMTQFSSAALPKDMSDGSKVSSHLSKDFVMYVGGPVWALDWCPRVHKKRDSDVNLEFVAIAAHPPESSYHKVGAPVIGRGVIQIWGLLNPGGKDHDAISQVKKKSKKNLRNKTAKNEETQPKRPRGRPKKNLINESANLVVPVAEDSTNLPLTDGISQGCLGEVVTEDIDKKFKLSTPRKPRERPIKIPLKESIDNFDFSSKHLEPLAIMSKEDTEIIDFSSVKPDKPIKRVRKKKTKESVSNIYGDSQYVEPLSMKFPDGSSKLFQVHDVSGETPEVFSKEDDSSNYSDSCAVVPHEDQEQNPRGIDAKVVKLSKPRKSKEDKNNQTCEAKESSKVLPEVSKKISSQKRKGYEKGDSVKSVFTSSKSRLTKCKQSIKSQDPMRSIADKANCLPLEIGPDSCHISEDVSLPRLVVCLAHNGKIAWDVKWRPFDTCIDSKHRMGYLGVLLGNGALEVWEVPHPRATEVMFSACQEDGTDPRFIELEPIFRCAMLKCGDRQSIPLTMEWSTSSPHDLILAGCHDGMVALWKFSANCPLKDTRPLICFSADTVPIRALAWAPATSDLESANIVVTAGHKGVKFWDIRDPFRPLWDVNPVQRVIYGVDWLPDPRCVVLSFDDGEIRIISLSKAACDVAVTGTPFVGTQLQGLNSYHCSSSSIWSVQVSRLTGMVAYCCSDGKVLRFQLTTKAVEKDPRRNREPHYLCGGLTMEGSTLSVFSPLPNEVGETPRSRRGFLTISNQEKRAREQRLKCQTTEEQVLKYQTPEELVLKYRTSEEQPLALCYNNDPGSDPGPDDTLVAQKDKPTSKTKCNSKKKPKTDVKQASTSADEVPTVNEKEVFPSKIVAIHRVRWNMNKGSERWLCYGGAAGIVRCQEISSD